MSIPEKIKLGKLSLSEQAFIKANVGSMDSAQIAKKLRRRVSNIEKLLEEKTTTGVYITESLEVLRRMNQYHLLKEELSDKEIRIFSKLS